MSIKTNIVWQYGLQIAKYVFPFLTIPYLTRVLGADVYAVRAYVLAAMTFVQVFVDYGFTYYGTKQIAEAGMDRPRESEITSAIVVLRIIICVIAALALAAITFCIPIMRDNVLYVAIAYIGVCLKGMLPDFVFQGQEDMGIITRRYVGSQLVAIVLIFLIIRGPEDLLLVPVFEGLAALVAFLWSWINVFAKRGIRLARISVLYVANVFKESSIFFFSNAATTAFTAFTTIMIGIFIDEPAQISYWAVAMTAVQAVQSLYSPLVNSIYPRMCKVRKPAILKPFLLYGGVAVAVGTVLFGCLGDVVMLVLGGEDYLAGAYIIPLVAPVLFFSYFGMLIGFPVLGAFGKVKELSASSVIAAIFHIAALIALACTGAFFMALVAVTRCVTECIMMVLRIAFVKSVFWKN